MSNAPLNGQTASLLVRDAQEQELARLRQSLRGIQTTLFLAVQAAGGEVHLTQAAQAAMPQTARLEMETLPDGIRLFISGAGIEHAPPEDRKQEDADAE